MSFVHIFFYLYEEEVKSILSTALQESLSEALWVSGFDFTKTPSVACWLCRFWILRLSSLYMPDATHRTQSSYGFVSYRMRILGIKSHWYKNYLLLGYFSILHI